MDRIMVGTTMRKVIMDITSLGKHAAQSQRIIAIQSGFGVVAMVADMAIISAISQNGSG